MTSAEKQALIDEAQDIARNIIVNGGITKDQAKHALEIVNAHVLTLARAVLSNEPPSPRASPDEDTWRKPPPHFKPDPRWQRQPQSNDEWDSYKDEVGMREFRAKRRLAFAGDLADPRAPDSMALVSRLDLSVVLGRLSWLEARFENTATSALPAATTPQPEPPVRQPPKAG